MAMITAYDTQRLGGSMLDAMVAQTVRQELIAQAEARRKQEARQAEELAYSRRRCNQLRAELSAKNEAALSPVIDRRWSVLDIAWGVWGLAILMAGAAKDAAQDAGTLIREGAAKAAGWARQRARNEKNRRKRVRRARKLAKGRR